MSKNRNLAAVIAVPLALIAACAGISTYAALEPVVPATPPEKDPQLKHWVLVWAVTTSKKVEDKEQDSPYKPGEKLPLKGWVAPLPKPTHIETTRLLCAHECFTKQEADAFMEAAPPEIKKHMHEISEDE